MNGPELLHQHIDRLKSSMGACFPGERAIFRGHDLHVELKNMDWIELYVFGITGRRFTEKQLSLLHAIWVCTSYPDARIWNNRVAALAGSSRSTGALGIAAALAVSEASIYGGGIYIPSINFLKRTLKALNKGVELVDCVRDELKKHRSIAGYGRPLVSGDERIVPIMSLARSLGLGDGPHVQLAFEVDELLAARRWRLRINYGAIAAALCADLGLSPYEYYLFVFPAFLAGMPPCYIESSERPEGTLFPLSCDHILYEGPPKRSWKSGKSG
ncbi:citryl-CoA lyase [Pelotalea chapellei]|uniref:Citryl-CoA lyase n=1 Tax=Pelotalea chapellei TaxID=44671 RepID=A0ABS5UBG3_9BACT|nr:citryl-CoA lyase [Pelotalea chapellei]MBT1073003.1 citryl-CoA lyase [Pelotalea chapellei]